MPLIKYKSKYTPLISPKKDNSNPIYNWHSFKHGFTNDLVFTLIKDLKIQEQSWILDPFCGGGTTLLASKQKNINSIGIDILPFSVFLSNVKTRCYDEKSLFKIFKDLKDNITSDFSPISKIPTDIPLVHKAFSKTVRYHLDKIKHIIDRIEEKKYQDFFNLAFLSTLEKVSNTSKDGGFLRIVERNLVDINVTNLFFNRCSSMIGDIISINSNPKQNNVSTYATLGDARNYELDQTFDAIITSPPYLNRHDYTRIYELELVFDFVKNNEELKRIRYKTLRSHVEAKKQFSASDIYEEPKIIQKLIERLKKNGLNNNQLPEMISGYFEDMFICLEQMHGALKKGGKIALVVSNVRFGGINIPVDVLLSQIGEQVGLKPSGIWVIRKRGNSSQQMKNYKRKTSRESIILWTK